MTLPRRALPNAYWVSQIENHRRRLHRPRRCGNPVRSPVKPEDDKTSHRKNRKTIMRWISRVARDWGLFSWPVPENYFAEPGDRTADRRVRCELDAIRARFPDHA